MELVLSQQSSPSGTSAPETPITDPSAVTVDLNPRIPPITPEPPTPAQNPEVRAAEPEALTSPAENTTMEHEVQEKDQVNPGKQMLFTGQGFKVSVFELWCLCLCLCLTGSDLGLGRCFGFWPQGLPVRP